MTVLKELIKFPSLFGRLFPQNGPFLGCSKVGPSNSSKFGRLKLQLVAILDPRLNLVKVMLSTLSSLLEFLITQVQMFALLMLLSLDRGYVIIPASKSNSS